MARGVRLVIRASLLIAGLLLVGCSTPEERAAELAAMTKEARAWCDRMGIRITGVSCGNNDYPYTACDIAPEQGAPFRLRCDGDGCSLPMPASN